MEEQVSREGLIRNVTIVFVRTFLKTVRDGSVDALREQFEAKQQTSRKVAGEL